MIIVTDPEKAFRDRVGQFLSTRSDQIDVERTKAVPGALQEAGDEITVVLLGPNVGDQEAFDLASQIQLTSPEVGVVLVTRRHSPDVLRAAMQSGIRDVLPVDFGAVQLVRAIERCEQVSRAMRAHGGRNAPSAQTASANNLFTVIGPKGGVGKSFLASNLAVILAKRGHSVALVDLDLENGDLSTMLQLQPQRTIADVVRDLDRLDEEALRRYLTPHRSGVSVLAAPSEPGEIEAVTVDQLPDLFRALRAAYRYVIVDTPATITDHALSAVDQSDLLAAVATMDVPSIKGMRSTMRALAVLGIDKARMRLVLNRADSQVGLSLGEVEKTLEASLDATIPSSREVPLSINLGTPISIDAPRSPVTRSLTKVVDVLCGATPAPEAPTRRFHLGSRR